MSDATQPHDFVDKDGDGECDICDKAKDAEIHDPEPDADDKPAAKSADPARIAERHEAAALRGTFLEAAGIRAGQRITAVTRLTFQPGAVQADWQRLARSAAMPAGVHRPDNPGIPATLRAVTVQRNGKELYQLSGVASVTDKPYEMYDWLGTYDEIIERGAFVETLAADPDVSFLINHTGMTLARTTNRTLDLRLGATGLECDAYLNPQRSEVDSLVRGIDDGDITEMSFAFMLEEGWWSDDFETFRISKLSMNRGDVSAVNYGANPFTTIGARTARMLRDLVEISPAAARKAITILQGRGDVAELARREDARALVEAETVAVRLAREAATCADEPQGRSILSVEAMLSLDED